MGGFVGGWVRWVGRPVAGWGGWVGGGSPATTRSTDLEPTHYRNMNSEPVSRGVAVSNVSRGVAVSNVPSLARHAPTHISVSLRSFASKPSVAGCPSSVSLRRGVGGGSERDRWMVGAEMRGWGWGGGGGGVGGGRGVEVTTSPSPSLTPPSHLIYELNTSDNLPVAVLDRHRQHRPRPEPGL